LKGGIPGHLNNTPRMLKFESVLYAPPEGGVKLLQFEVRSLHFFELI